MSETQSHWGYTKEDGPSTSSWPLLCHTGKKQSPIDISQSENPVLTRTPILASLNWQIQMTATVTNTGHSIEVDMGVKTSTVTVNGDSNHNPYILQQLHFHCKSEHMIDGIQYPIEMHAVHTRGAKGHEEYLVIGAFFVADDNIDDEINEQFDKITKVLPSDTTKFKAKATASIKDFNPSLLVDIATEPYYNYTGSLTTPGCTEGVNWFVIAEPKMISTKNLQKFQQYYSANARDVQILGSRTIDFYVPKAKPIDVVLLLDVSGSMRDSTGDGSTKLQLLQTEAATFISVAEETSVAENANSQLGIVTFESTGQKIQALTTLGGTSLSTILPKIAKFKASGGTNVSDAIMKGYDMLSASNSIHQKAMLLFSDGAVTIGANPTTLESKYYQYPIYTIGYGTSASGLGYLKTISEKSGGEFYITGNPTSLMTIFNELLEDAEIAPLVTNAAETVGFYTKRSAFASIAENIKQAIFAVSWNDHSVTYTRKSMPSFGKEEIAILLYAPGAKSAYSGAVVQPGKGFAILTVTNPPAGQWKIQTWYSGTPKSDEFGVAFASFTP